MYFFIALFLASAKEKLYKYIFYFLLFFLYYYSFCSSI
jgi:hypothetical protein